MCKGHELRGFVGSISEHDTLVTSANIFVLDSIDGLGNIWGLLLNGNDNVASLVVEALGRIVVADVLDGVADNLFVVDGGGGGDLSEDHNHAGLAATFTGNTGHGVASNAGV